MKHIISVLVENKPAVLARVIGLISGRGYNIDSLNVAPTQDVTTSRITMTVPGDEHVLEQVIKQLNKLVDVIKVFDMGKEKYIDRELILVKVCASAKNRSALIELATLFHAENVVVQNKTMIIQMVGAVSEVDNFMELIKPHGIVDVVRTGVVAVGRMDG